jgi:hypothetical protein
LEVTNATATLLRREREVQLQDGAARRSGDARRSATFDRPVLGMSILTAFARLPRDQRDPFCQAALPAATCSQWPLGTLLAASRRRQIRFCVDRRAAALMGDACLSKQIEARERLGKTLGTLRQHSSFRAGTVDATMTYAFDADGLDLGVQPVRHRRARTSTSGSYRVQATTRASSFHVSSADWQESDRSARRIDDGVRQPNERYSHWRLRHLRRRDAEQLLAAAHRRNVRGRAHARPSDVDGARRRHGPSIENSYADAMDVVLDSRALEHLRRRPPSSLGYPATSRGKKSTPRIVSSGGLSPISVTRSTWTTIQIANG